MQDVLGGKLGGTTLTMVEAKYNGVVVWPLQSTTTYEVSSAYLVYYRDGAEIYTYNYIPADGSVYAKCFGDVKVYENGVYSRTLSWVELEVSLTSGSSLYISDNEIHGPDRGYVETPAQAATVMATYGGSLPRSAGQITQEANVKTASGSPTYGEKVYDYEHQVQGEPYGYHVELSATDFYTEARAASAGLNTTSLSVSNAYHWLPTITPYTQTVSQHYTYTARPQGRDETRTISDTESVDERILDSVSPTKVSGDSAITLSGLVVTLPSRGTTPGEMRSATFRAVNGDAQDEVTIYQQRNRIESTTYDYDLSVSIQHTGRIPASGGLYGVTYTSRRVTIDTYSSGAQDSSAPVAIAASVSGINCTPDVSSVSGQGAFAISVDQNTSQASTRTISVTLTVDASHSATDSRTQEASQAAVVASLSPVILPAAAGVYEKGVIYVSFGVTSGTLASTTLYGVQFHYIVNGGSESVVDVGSITVTDGADPMPALQDLSSAIGIPSFTRPGYQVEAWFSATGTGDVDTMTYPHYTVTIQ